MIKRLASSALSPFGYEIKKHQLETELHGLPYSEFLDCYLRRFRHDPYVIQIGAHDGVVNDVLHDAALEFNMKGVLLEPQVSCFHALQETYAGHPSLALENAAISHEDGHKTLHTIRKDLPFLQYANQAASFNRDHVLRQLTRHLKYHADENVLRELRARSLSPSDCIQTEVVHAMSFPSLLKKYGIVRGYDLLMIDAEGFDYEIIKLAEIPRLTQPPSLINYEHEHLTPGDRDAAWAYLTLLGYKLLTHKGDTTAYK